MVSSSLSTFVSSDGPIDFEIRNHGRVLVVKDALYNPSTRTYHDIKLVRTGWKFLGIDFGGAGQFTGITDDVVRQIQATYGIVLKTLHSEPNGVTFWGNAKKTSYITGDNASEKYTTRWMRKVKTSYPFGQKKDDLLLSKEDAAHFRAEQMTLHDAVNTGIWSAEGQIGGHSLATNASNDNPISEKDPSLEGGQQSSGRPQSANSKKKGQNNTGRERPERKTQRSEKDKEEADFEPLIKDRSDSVRSDSVGKQSGKRNKAVVSEPLRSVSNTGQQIHSLPSIPAYSSQSTPAALDYDDVPFEERKRRMIDHLDQFSPIPFSAFIDNNADRRIDPFLFRRMVEALRKLAANPESGDSDAKYMNNLCKHWFRAAYHYLDKNSKPGDGYAQILSKIAETVKDPAKAEAQAKELYWRRHATHFWMTLIDLFAAEKINIDPFHKFLSLNTSLSSFF